MRHLVEREGLENEIELDSAGTGSWHVGSPPDARATAAAARRGVNLAGTARRIEREDLEQFDLILAMDRTNLGDLRALVSSAENRKKVRLLREFDPASADNSDLDVPDPYHGGVDGFGTVFELVQAACEGLLADIQAGRVS